MIINPDSCLRVCPGDPSMGRDSPFGAYLTETYLSDVPKTPLKIPIFRLTHFNTLPLSLNG